jgi:hypothetical protein
MIGFANTKKSAQQTAQHMIAGHFTLIAWWTLKHAGVFDAMLKLETDSNEGLHPLVHAARTNMAPDILDALLDYLASTNLVTLKDGYAHLTPDAKALLDHEDGVLELVHAYQPILDMAEHMLARLKTASSGTPVHRKSDALSEAQAKRYTAEVFPAILALLQKHKLANILDLSCAAGDLLIHLAANTKNIVGVGIGSDGQAVRRANQSITDQKLERRLIAVTASPSDVCTDTERTFERIGISKPLWDNLDCLIAPQLLSEINARDHHATATGGGAHTNANGNGNSNGGGAAPGGASGALLRILATIPRKFPNAHLLVIEPTATPRFQKNYYAPELSLLLRLSKSSPWPPEQWRDLFQQSKLTLVQETPLTTDGLTLFLCKAAR